jgi:GAF domain-containing protein
MSSQNSYARNVITGATANPLMPTPDEVDEAFARQANKMLLNAVEVVRQLVPAHQAAVAIVIGKDWRYVRKFFSLSEKYAPWAGYDTPAVGYGAHHWLLSQQGVVRLTQQELENHPEWKGFGTEAGKHPPMRGWLAAPIVDQDGTNWGLLQLSDKLAGEFTETDEEHFVRFTQLLAQGLEALWEVRNLQKPSRATGQAQPG